MPKPTLKELEEFLIYSDGDHIQAAIQFDCSPTDVEEVIQSEQFDLFICPACSLWMPDEEKEMDDNGEDICTDCWDPTEEPV